MKPEMYTCQSLERRTFRMRNGVSEGEITLGEGRSHFGNLLHESDVWQLPFQPTLAMKKHYPPLKRPGGFHNHLQTESYSYLPPTLSGASVINVHMSSITWHYSILAGNSILIVSFHAGWHGKWWLTSNIVMERFILPRVWRTVSYRWRFCVAAVSKQNCTNNDCLQTGFLSNPLVCYWLDKPNL